MDKAHLISVQSVAEEINEPRECEKSLHDECVCQVDEE